MVNKSRWKAAHDKFPAHVEEAKNSDGNVHRGYSLLEFRVAAELLRIGPVHSAEDYWAPTDWQLLLVVSEYMSALLEFLDWFWPDLGWEHHKQAIVLSKRLLQPRSPHTYPDLQIDPQLRAAWQSFTYCFWHGTRHLPAAPPSGERAAVYSAAREWLTKLVGERGFEAEGHIVSSLQSWIQSAKPRLQEAFPNVDWSRWPTVIWPDPECAMRGVEKRGAVKRRQQEEEFALRWPLRVTQGRPKFNHLKLEARDGFVVGIPPVKNPPVLGFLAVSDVMCAFKQAAQHWPNAQPGSPAYLAQQDVVQGFVQNVLRETRGPLAPGIEHDKYRFLGYVACSVLGWSHALAQLAHAVRETSAWGRLPLLLPGGAAAVMFAENLRQEQQLLSHLGRGGGGAAAGGGLSNLGPGAEAAMAFAPPLEHTGGMRVDLGIASQLATLPTELLLGPDTEAVLAMHLSSPPPPPPVVLPLAQPLLLHPPPPPQLAVPAGLVGEAAHCVIAASGMAEAAQGFNSVPLPSPSGWAGDAAATTAGGGGSLHRLGGQASAPLSSAAAPQPCRPDSKPTRPRPSPFGRGSNAASGSANTSAVSAGQGSYAASPVEVSPSPPPLHPQQQPQQSAPQETPPAGAPLQQPRSRSRQPEVPPGAEAGGNGRGAPPPASDRDLLEDVSAPMSLGGLSSMQDLIDGLPSQADLTWSAVLGAVGEDAGGGAAVAAAAIGTGVHGQPSAGPSMTASELQAGLPSLMLPSWVMLRAALPSQPDLGPSFGQDKDQARARTQAGPQPLSVQVPEPSPSPGPAHSPASAPSPGLLQPLDSGLPYGGLLQPPPPPPRLTPDAPVHVQPPLRASSPCQATITTGLLPPMPSTGVAGCGLTRSELSGPEPRLSRRSHGEVFTLSPVTSCGPGGEIVPCSPAPVALGAAQPAVAATAGEACTASASDTANAAEGPAHAEDGTRLPAGTRLGCNLGREKLPWGLPASGRRTRQDVAAAAAAAAADLGLPPAPGSLVERSAKRPNAQADPRDPVRGTAERVESLGAFLTDQLAGLAPDAQSASVLQPRTQPLAMGSKAAAANGTDRVALGLELLHLLRSWAGADTATQDTDAAVRHKAAKLLEQGACVHVSEGASATADAAANAGSGGGYTALHWACARGDVALAELLLRHGADPDRCDAAGMPARLVNPAFAAQLAEAQRRAAEAEAGRVSTATATAHQAMASVFASSGGTVAASAAAVDGPAAQPDSLLRIQLAELLRSADLVAAQLAARDPQAAAGQVLQAMRDTNFLFPTIVSGTTAK